MNTIDSLILANMALISILLHKYSGQDNVNIFGTIPSRRQLHGDSTNGGDDCIY